MKCDVRNTWKVFLRSPVAFLIGLFHPCVKTSEVHTAATDNIVTTQPLFSVGQHTRAHTHIQMRKERAKGCNRADEDHGVAV